MMIDLAPNGHHVQFKEMTGAGRAMPAVTQEILALMIHAGVLEISIDGACYRYHQLFPHVMSAG